MTGFCPYKKGSLKESECHYDGYCSECPHNTKDDTISRAEAIELVTDMNLINDTAKGILRERLRKLTPTQPERLTDDDFETIRIHLSACKERLCNQRRWKEAEEYQRIIDRFMSFASTQPVDKDINVPINDTISRQAAIELAMQYCPDDDGSCSKADRDIRELLDDLENLPPAQPDVSETNVGEWIPMYNGKLTGGAYWFSCAKCKRVVPDVRNGGWEYCPRCGKRNILNR